MSAREPVAVLGLEDFRIVKFTHDVEVAAKLMRKKLWEENGCPGDVTGGFCTPFGRDDCPHWETASPGSHYLDWIRIVPCLPNSYGAMDGWAFEYQAAKANSRGAFKAVVFT